MIGERTTALKAIAAGIALGAALVFPATASEKGAHWGYGAKDGPARWAKLSPKKYKTCGSGRTQSPIDVPRSTASRASSIAFRYRAGSAAVVNNGHAIEVKVQKGNALYVGGRRYELLQFHFHTPSENTIAGKRFPMEMHLVHKDASGRLAVVGVMIEPGVRGHPIDALPVPRKAGAKVSIRGAVHPIRLLPATKRHYAFMGSLTTPPCSEGVRWFVMAAPVRVRAATLRRFRQVMGKNNRPVRPLNSRRVVLGR